MPLSSTTYDVFWSINPNGITKTTWWTCHPNPAGVMSHDDFLAGSTESEKCEKNPVTCSWLSKKWGIPPSGLRGVMVMTGWFRATPMTSETSTSSCESRVPELWEAPNHPAFITMEIPTGNPIKNHHKSSIFSQQNPIEHLFMVVYWDLMGFNGISWDFMVILWWFYDLLGISWWFPMSFSTADRPF